MLDEKINLAANSIALWLQPREIEFGFKLSYQTDLIQYFPINHPNFFSKQILSFTSLY
jgi:hypothetical protein